MKINSSGEVVKSSPLDWLWNLIAFIMIFFKSLFNPSSNSRGDRFDTADRRDRFRGDGNDRGNGGGGGGGGGLGGPQRRIGGLNRGSGVAPPPTGGGCSGGGCGR